MVQIRENPSVAPRQPLYLARCKGYSRLRRLASSATAASRQYPPHTSRLKTAHRAVFYAAHPLRVRIPLKHKNKSNTVGVAFTWRAARDSNP